MRETTGVRGGGSLRVPDYAGFLAEHYLAGYLPAGGAAVKVAVVGSPETASRLARALGAAADTSAAVFVAVPADEVRVDHVEQLFFAVARHLDWDALAAALVRSAYASVHMPAGDDLTVAQVAADHDLDARELYRSVRRSLEERLLRDSTLPRELGRAVYRLAQFSLGSSDVTPAEREAVRGWLRGERVPVAALRPALIHARIARHNARPLLSGLARLLLAGGAGGLVLYLDYARLAQSRRPALAERDGLYYSKAAVLDAYEVLRQLIDATDDLRGVLVVAAVPPSLVTDDARGLPAYAALALRVADEVRDRRRPNPFASLVRLEVRLEAVA